LRGLRTRAQPEPEGLVRYDNGAAASQVLGGPDSVRTSTTGPVWSHDVGLNSLHAVNGLPLPRLASASYVCAWQRCVSVRVPGGQRFTRCYADACTGPRVHCTSLPPATRGASGRSGTCDSPTAPTAAAAKCVSWMRRAPSRQHPPRYSGDRGWMDEREDNGRAWVHGAIRSAPDEHQAVEAEQV